MKRTSQTLPLALLAAAVRAQTVVNNPGDPGVTTLTFTSCPTATQTTITAPSTITCPGPYCTGLGPTITGAPGLGDEILDYTTVLPNGQTEVIQEFVTVLGQPCPGCAIPTYPATFTVTEVCPCEASRNPSSLPAGFTTTVYSCDVNGTPMVSTMTVPQSTGPYAAQATASANAAASAAASAGTANGSGSGAEAGAGAAAAAAATGSGSQAAAGAGAGAGAGAAAGSPGTGSGAEAGASSGAGASAGADTGGTGASSGSGAGAASGGTANDVAPGSGSASNSTVSPPIAPVAPGSSNTGAAVGAATYTPGANAAGRVGASLFAALVGVVAFFAFGL